MIEIDWKDYQGEFICPYCNKGIMSLSGVSRGKKQFRCSTCLKTCTDSCQLNIQAVTDPTNPEIIWYKNHKILDFICPKCQTQNIYFAGINQEKKRSIFRCTNCKQVQCSWVRLSSINIGKLSNKGLPVSLFKFADDKWDLRSINPNSDFRDLRISALNFSTIYPDWFKQEVKRYVYHLTG